MVLNVDKTGEFIADFRRKHTNIKDPVFIDGKVIKQVDSFKLLGTHITRNLTWDVNCQDILKKARQRLYFLRKLNSFGVRQCILVNFYRAIIESILCSSITVWYGRACAKLMISKS